MRYRRVHNRYRKRIRYKKPSNHAGCNVVTDKTQKEGRTRSVLAPIEILRLLRRAFAFALKELHQRLALFEPSH